MADSAAEQRKKTMAPEGARVYREKRRNFLLALGALAALPKSLAEPLKTAGIVALPPPFHDQTATIAELSLAIMLLVGYRLRWTAYGAVVLLTTFGSTMIFSLGIKAPLDYSVFAAAGAALLLVAQTDTASEK